MQILHSLIYVSLTKIKRLTLFKIIFFYIYCIFSDFDYRQIQSAKIFTPPPPLFFSPFQLIKKLEGLVCIKEQYFSFQKSKSAAKNYMILVTKKNHKKLMICLKKTINMYILKTKIWVIFILQIHTLKDFQERLDNSFQNFF